MSIETLAETTSDSVRRQQVWRGSGYYLHRESVVPAGLLEGAVSGLEAVREGSSTPARCRSIGNRSRARSSLVKLEQPQVGSFSLRELLRSPALGEIIGEIHRGGVGAGVVGAGSRSSSSADEAAGAKVGWHQDRQYWDGWTDDSELLTAWLALSDVTADSGPMLFVPASHRWGLLGQGDSSSGNRCRI